MPTALRLSRVTIVAIAAAALMAAAEPVTDASLQDLWRTGNLGRMEAIASTGDVRAQHWMGLMLRNRGRFDEAISWYSRAVAQGDGRSANEIADFYEYGIGRAKDPDAALEWHRKAALLGDVDSQIRYAGALRRGIGIAANEAEAFKWYDKAASDRHAIAHLGYAYLPLAEMYESGSGTSRDLKRAYAYAKAAELTVDDSDTEGQERARVLMAGIAPRLQPAELAAAEQIFAEIRPDLQEGLARERFRKWTALVLLAALMLFTLLLAAKDEKRTRRSPQR